MNSEVSQRDIKVILLKDRAGGAQDAFALPVFF